MFMLPILLKLASKLRVILVLSLLLECFSSRVWYRIFSAFMSFQTHQVAEIGCTAIAVDSEASVDGSAMAGMNVDCAQCDNRLTYVASRDYGNITNPSRPVFENIGSYPRMVKRGVSRLYSPENNVGFAEFEPIAEIAQPRIKTYGYWESTMPLMNEAGISLGESSCGTKLVGTADAILDVTELMRIALERCSSARCAVETIGSVSEEYGFMAMKSDITPGTERAGTRAYDDAGEALVIADESGEAWVMHVTGGFEGVSKSTWAAKKVPKGHVAVLANTFTIGELPAYPNQDILFNLNIRETARAANLWKGSDSDPLDFTKIFGMDIVTFQRSNRDLPIPLYTTLRTWRVYDLLAPSLGLGVNLDNGVYPFSIKPDNKISHRDIFRILGDYYKDSEFDLTEGVLAGPFGTPYRHEGGVSKGYAQFPRAISIPRTSYSILGQSIENGKSVAWFASDQPMTSVFVPLLAAVRSEEGLDASFQRGNLLEFDRKSAFWAFDFVSNWMTLNWRNMSAEEVFPLQQRLQDHIDEEMKSSTTPLTSEWQRDVQKNVVRQWWELADRLIVKYNDGYYTRVEKDDLTKSVVGKSYGLPDWYNRMLGMTADVHPVWVQPWDGHQDTGIRNAPKDLFRTNYKFSVPKSFDFDNRVWITNDAAATASVPQGPAVSGIPFITIIISLVCGFGAGLFFSSQLLRVKPIKTEPLLG